MMNPSRSHGIISVLSLLPKSDMFGMFIWQDGEMNEMTLPSGPRIQNSSPEDLRSSTLPLVTEPPHNVES